MTPVAGLVRTSDRIERARLGLSTPLVGPRNELERRIVDIWQDELGVNPIGVEDDYYELGGNSLRGIEIFLRIEREFGARLPLAALVERPTISHLAGLIEQPAAAPEWRCLVPMTRRGPRPAFFGIHDSSGNVVVYRRLVEHLGPEQPFYGLQYPDQEQRPIPRLSIEAMATRYLEEIRLAQPAGPYYLGGYSIGGLIAFEAAQQLLAAGQEVALLAMFDSWAPGYPAEGLTKLGDHVIELCRRAPWTWPAYLRQRASYWLTRRTEQARTYDGGRSGVYVLERTILPAVRAAYTPRPYPGRIELFRCLEDRVLWRRTPELGWRGLAGQGIRLHDLPATHQNLLAEPAVVALAREFAGCLAEAQART